MVHRIRARYNPSPQKTVTDLFFVATSGLQVAVELRINLPREIGEVSSWVIEETFKF